MSAIDGLKGRKKAIVPICRCLICDDWIYPNEDYTFFAEGYAHAPCIAFHRLQVSLIRAAMAGQKLGE